MIRVLMISVLLVTMGVGSAQAYCRANTIQCKEMRLASKEAELKRRLALTPDARAQIEMQEEIESIRFEANRLEEKSHKTALNK